MHDLWRNSLRGIDIARQIITVWQTVAVLTRKTCLVEKFTTYHLVCSKINTTMLIGVRVNLFFLQVYKSNIIHCYNMLVGRGREGWWCWWWWWWWWWKDVRGIEDGCVWYTYISGITWTWFWKINCGSKSSTKIVPLYMCVTSKNELTLS